MNVSQRATSTSESPSFAKHAYYASNVWKVNGPATGKGLSLSFFFVLPLWGDIGSWGVMAVVKVVVVVVMAVAEVGKVHV